MKRVLADCGNNLNTLGKMTIAELTDGRYKGLGPAKAVAVLAACELGKRRQRETAVERKRFDNAMAIYEYMRPADARPRRGGGLGDADEPKLRAD